eukprot:gene6022-6633_t
MEPQEGEEEYEEVLVMVNFEALDGADIFKGGQQVEISGLGGPTPRCRLGELDFQGRHEYSLGTQLFFEESPSTRFLGQSVNCVTFSLSAPPKPAESVPVDKTSTDKLHPAARQEEA